MSYTLTSLTTKADCTAVINIANNEKDGLAYRKEGLRRQSESALLNATEIASSLAAVEAQLAALNSILSTLPPGPTYNENQVSKTKAEYKKFLLEQRKGNYGPIALVEKQYDIACIDQAIVEADAFIAALMVRRDELPS